MRVNPRVHAAGSAYIPDCGLWEALPQQHPLPLLPVPAAGLPCEQQPVLLASLDIMGQRPP